MSAVVIRTVIGLVLVELRTLESARLNCFSSASAVALYCCVIAIGPEYNVTLVDGPPAVGSTCWLGTLTRSAWSLSLRVAMIHLHGMPACSSLMTWP